MVIVSGLSRKILRSKYNFGGNSFMKIIVRAFIVVLAITGAAASTQISSASTSKVTIAKVNALPIPMCAPDDPNACHIDGK
jgi:cytochrome b subunit of formate dehydrogenase